MKIRGHAEGECHAQAHARSRDFARHRRRCAAVVAGLSTVRRRCGHRGRGRSDRHCHPPPPRARVGPPPPPPPPAGAPRGGGGKVPPPPPRRSSPLLDVPIAETAVTAKRMAESGASDIRQLNQLSPSLLVSSTSSEAG